MTIEFQQEKQDVVAASWMMMRKVKIIFLVAVAIVSVIAIPSFRAALASHSSMQIAISLIPVSLMTVFLALLLWWQPRGAAKKAILRRVTWELSETDVKISSEVSNSTIQWQAFFKYREGKKVFLLFTQKNFANFIPKRVLSQTEVDGLRAILAAHIKRG